jgi:solute carrier family 29 (equilibrative nucleoside transporter), member 1/2/3
MDEKKPIGEIGAPPDTGNFAYYIMFYLGVGNLFPWNAFITASTYYAMRFCGTSVEESFENYFSITYTLSQTIGLFLAILYQDRLTLTQKISKPLLLYSAIFGVTTILVLITSMDGILLFGLTLLSAFLSGSVGAVLSGGLFGLGAMLPSAYTGAIMSGQGLAGLIVSVSAVLTLYAGGDTSSCDDESTDDGTCEQSISYSALAYFMIATIVLLTCSLAFSSLMRMTFTK